MFKKDLETCIPFLYFIISFMHINFHSLQPPTSLPPATAVFHQNLHSISEYRVTHKGWDCNDDLKLFKYDDLKVKLKLLPWILSSNGYLYDLAKNITSSKLQGIMNTYRIISVQSSLKSHSLWVTLYKRMIDWLIYNKWLTWSFSSLEW